MNEETLKALNDSIAHWERLAQSRRQPVTRQSKKDDGDDGFENIYAEDCALCEIFHNEQAAGGDLKCRGCPVAAASGHSHCEETPWFNAYYALLGGNHSSPQFLAAAAEMLAFLKAVLEKETTTPTKETPHA